MIRIDMIWGLARTRVSLLGNKMLVFSSRNYGAEILLRTGDESTGGGACQLAKTLTMLPL